MITYPKYLDRSETPVVRLIGLGNAGVNLADRISMGGRLDIETVAINSDQQSLSSSVASTKISLGPLTTRGLGAGGDPEIGLDAARESEADLEAAVAGADIIFLCAGLGGGTGSGAAGLLARAAKKSDVLLLAIITSPFAFEGRRRSAQAAAALREISESADAVIHFENDRMAELSEPRQGVAETFSCCDELLGGCVESVVRLVSAPGPLGVGLPDLLAVLRGGDGNCLFGTSSASGDNRAHEALEEALASPLLDQGRLLDDASSVLIHISGPPSLSFAEVGAIMREISKKTPDSSLLHVGVSTLPDHAAPLVLSLIAKCGAARSAAAPQPRAEPSTRRPEARRLEREAPPVESEPLPSQDSFIGPDPAPPLRPPQRTAPRQPQPEPRPEPKAPAQKVKQETLQFEPVARGRFEKIAPTIIEGEDLDVPTFLRLGGKKH